jgi:hypothetical protein
LSGKKESTTASRSPTSDVDKKEHEEVLKSVISENENPVKLRHDIRSYFMPSEKPEKRVIIDQIFKIKRDKRPM